MAEFFVTIEGMWSSNGKWEAIADRPEPIVPPKVTIKGKERYKKPVSTSIVI